MSIFDKYEPVINGKSVAKGKTAAFTLDIPQGALVRSVFIRNNTANAVTGGVKVGTTLGGTDVVAAAAVAASTIVLSAALIGAVNRAGVRTLYIDAVTAWNSANLDVAVTFTDTE